MMQLDPDEVQLFYKLWYGLLSHVGKLNPNLIDKATDPDEIAFEDLADLAPLRDRLYEDPQIIDAFVRENPCGFAPDELAIVSGWRHFVKGQFVLFRQLKNYAIFLEWSDPPKAYGVLALGTPFELMVADFPILVEIALLPFRGHITYDGIFYSHSLLFGGGMRSSMNSDYQRAKSTFGIITSLPFEPKEEEHSDEELLRFYLKSEHNREQYWDDIWDLMHCNPSLLPIYHQEYGRCTARRLRRDFKGDQIAAAWFGVLDENVIASGNTQKAVTDAIESMLPIGRRLDVYIFQWKP